MVLKRCSLLVVLALAGCVERTPPVRLLEAARVPTVVVVDDTSARAVLPTPEPVARQVGDTLGGRNLQPEIVSSISGVPVTERFSLVRDTERRLAELAAAAPEAPLVVLVELSARFYSHIAGRFRWNVAARLSVRGKDGVVLGDALELPVVLDFHHEREAEALGAASGRVAERLGALVDDYLRGRSDLEKAARLVLGGGAVFAPQPAAHGDLIYFVLVDRFDNGDPANDADVDLRDPTAWHGGDLEGVRRRLDYLADLGVRTVWLSPVFETRGQSFHGHGAFHGYWVKDLARIDARFGGLPALVRLRQELEARGMRLLLDMVVNHTSFDAPLVTGKPEWFHRRGSISDWNDPVQLETYDVHGLPDLAVERDDVFAYLFETSTTLIEKVRPAGFRLDAVKHVPNGFWSRYNGALAERFGKSFVRLGEVYDGRPEILSRAQRDGGFSHLFDFPLAFALRDVFCKDAPAAAIAAVLSQDSAYADPRSLVTFLDNHDLPRITSECGGDTSRVVRALEALFTLRGTPSLTYGTEVALTGMREPDNRGDMRFHGSAPLAPVVRELSGHRRQEPLLASADSFVLGATDAAVVLLRTLPGRSDGLLVSINTGEETEVTLAPLAGCSLDDRPITSTMTLGLRRHETSVGRVCDGGSCRLTSVVQPASREVRFVVPSAEGDVAIVGSGAGLGNWELARGLVVRGGEARVALPVGAVFAYKLVRLTSGGPATWESGGNRHLHVGRGAGALDVELRFRVPPA